MTEVMMQEAVDLVAQHGSQRAAAKAAGIPLATLRDRVDAAGTAGITSKIERADSPAAMTKEIAKLKQSLKVHESRSSDIEQIKAVVGKLSKGVESLAAPDFILNAPKGGAHHGVPTLFLSDLHWGEVVHPSQINGVNQYNMRIAKERMQTCIDSAVHLLKLLSPKMEYPGLVLALGGDNVSGGIHEELAVSDEMPTMPVLLDLFSTLRGIILKLLEIFPHIFIPCVTGNHGRNTHKIYAKNRQHTSFDWLLYKFLAESFAGDKRVTFFIPDGPDAYYRVYGHRYLLTHGDQFRGGDGMIGALGPIIRGDHKKRSRNAQIDMEYDTMIIGHWHQYIHLTRLIVNGSLKGYDEYAYSSNFGFEAPQQALWITHPKRGITYRMPVYVDRQRAVPKTAWVSVAG